MKVIGINGSPRRKASRTLQLVQAVLDGAEKEGAETELIDICTLDINFCTGCGTCYASGDCIHDDDAPGLFAKLQQADGIVLGSPVYIDTVTAQLKRWIDRLADAIHCQMLAGKYGCSVSTAGGAMEKETVDYMNRVLNALGVITIGGVGIALSQGPDALPNAKTRAYKLGRKLAYAIMTRKKFPKLEAHIQERKEFFCRLVTLNKDAWQHQYDYWVRKGEIQP
jgi:multimeric flavodoxin WrbA